MTAVPAAFAAAYDFALDDFQADGIGALEAGRSVLVAAPTGSGKTIVGEYATWAALRDGGKCFYTTPIKALSNQKHSDLCARYGAARVGLLTGDRSVNGEAPIVVMTTEVLRNMLYEQSPTLRGLRAVVLDEVHYLADRERGAVWEEVIIQLPASVQLACLSATVSNAEEFGAWLADVRLGCEVVISEDRPVPLDHHYAIGTTLHPMFRAGRVGGRTDRGGQRQARARRAVGGVPNPEVVMLERRAAGQRRARGRRGGDAGVRLRPPRRSELVYELRRRRWLPAIVFIFSRSGCDRALEQLVGDGVSLTSADERREIRRLTGELTADADDRDLRALGFGLLSDALEHGLAAHHAGMVPVLKELVEALFVRGLVKVCFATETLALGINMPARTVAIEQLEKWNGQSHELLTPGQFTQLTGRAGRRGLDTLGHAIVSYQRTIDFATVANLVGQRVEPLRSRFAPTYNMAVNLLRRRTLEEAEALLEQSFAQYQAAAGVARLTDRIADNRVALDGYAANLVSDRGDAREYLALRRELSDLERTGHRQRRAHRRARQGRDTAALYTATPDTAMPGRAASRPETDGEPIDRTARIAELRAAVRAHPVHGDARRGDIERWASRHDDLSVRTEMLERDVERRTGSLSREVRRIVTVLRDLGYLTDGDAAPVPTADGLRLAGLYADTDLLLAESVRDGILDEVRGADLAAVLSVFVHETRSRDRPYVRYPSAVVGERIDRVEALWERVSAREQRAGLTPTRAPDPGMCAQVWRWAHGADLDAVLGGGELTGGDFVRGVKQIADLARQISSAYDDQLVGRQARRAADLLLRGVVAAA